MYEKQVFILLPIFLKLKRMECIQITSLRKREEMKKPDVQKSVIRGIVK